MWVAVHVDRGGAKTDDQRRAAPGRHDSPAEWQPGADHGAAPPPRRRSRRDDEPFDVRIEFVVLDGEAGKELARRRAAVVRKVLQWFHGNPANAAEDGSGTDQTA